VSTTLAGVAGSYLFDLPTGSAIILTQALVFVAAAFTQRR
jgi:ABC-type Mn2+/Zn2+ transport system permease subunit